MSRDFTYAKDHGAEVITDDVVHPLLTLHEIPAYEHAYRFGHIIKAGKQDEPRIIKFDGGYEDVMDSEPVSEFWMKDDALNGWDRIGIGGYESCEGVVSGAVYRFEDGGVVVGGVLLTW